MNLLLITALALAADPSSRADALDLLLVNDERLARLELRVDIDGKSVPSVWDETFAKLHAFFDRDGDGGLSRAEAARLPASIGVRQVLWGQFVPSAGDPLPFDHLDLNADGQVSRDEMVEFYRRGGLGGVLVGVGKPLATDKLTDAILKAIDVNNDGTTDETEWKKAAEILAKLDANDDELVGPGELVERVAYPGTNGSVLLTPPSPDGKTDPTCAALPLVLLPLRTSDTHWEKAVIARREKAKRLASDVSSVRTDKPASSWQVKLDGKPAAPFVHSAGGLRVVLRTDAGRLSDQTVAVRKRFNSMFTEADADANGNLDAKELAASRASQFQQLLAAADRDGSQTLSKKELAGWLDLQGQIARGCVLLTLLDHGRGLFEVLDADHDGGLGVRELRTAWERLNAAGCVTDGKFDRVKLPRHLLACVSHGHPQSALGKPTRPGPGWFLAMDRNGDGDLSAKEWVGDLNVFRKLDADGDGLLDAQEAATVRRR